MNLGFVTCVQLGLSCMEAIYAVGGNLRLAITLSDDRAAEKSGRVYLDDFCQHKNIPLIKCTNVNDDLVIDAIKKNDLDWLFIIGWSQIAEKVLLDAPRLGVLGMHPTLLPEGRGRAAIPWAILKKLPKTGVTLFKLDEGVDTGPIAGQRQIPMTDGITASELYEMVNLAHIELIKEVIPKVFGGQLNLRAQDHLSATVWEGRRPEDGNIDLNGSVWDADRLVRAVTHPYPGAFVIINNIKITIWAARVSDDKPTAEAIEFKDGYLELLSFTRESCLKS